MDLTSASKSSAVRTGSRDLTAASRIEASSKSSASRAKEARFAPYWEVYYETVVKKSSKILDRGALSDYRWMLEEFRVSVFAQEIKTAAPVSPKRLEAKLAEAIEV